MCQYITGIKTDLVEIEVYIEKSSNLLESCPSIKSDKKYSSLEAVRHIFLGAMYRQFMLKLLN